jgi:hypothetical protein
MDHILFAVAVFFALQLFWQRATVKNVPVETEVERIAVLKRAAAARRAEYAAEREQGTDPAAVPPFCRLTRRQVEDAEAAYASALQAWENKQSRQKSR